MILDEVFQSLRSVIPQNFIKVESNKLSLFLSWVCIDGNDEESDVVGEVIDALEDSHLVTGMEPAGDVECPEDGVGVRVKLCVVDPLVEGEDVLPGGLEHREAGNKVL